MGRCAPHSEFCTDMPGIWTPRQSRIVQRSEAEVVVEVTRSLHASAEAFLASAVLIVERMRDADQKERDNLGQHLRAAAHFVLGTAYELTLKLMLRQSGRTVPNRHQLTTLYDAIPDKKIRALLDEAYQQRMASVSEHEVGIILTMVTTGDPQLETDPPKPDMTTIRGWFRFMDEDVCSHLQRYAWENPRNKRPTQHMADLTPFCDILKVTLARVGVPPEPTTPTTIHISLEDRVNITDFTDSLSWSKSPGSD